MTASVRPMKSTGQLQLRIELDAVEPLVWRRVLVPDTVTLAGLHRVIQVAMGWADRHRHVFEIRHRRFGDPKPDRAIDGGGVSEDRISLMQVLQGHRSFSYLYDFGDGWWHSITLEGAPRDAEPERYAVCVGGENACPPEDVGGAVGYAEYIVAVTDVNHPEHEDMIDWNGPDFDPTAFDIVITNAILKRVRC